MTNRQDVDTKTIDEENFTEYVAYNQYGGIEKRVDRSWLEDMLKRFIKYRVPQLGCWELREGDDGAIDVRISPRCDIDAGQRHNNDNNWRTWNYTFVPYVP